MMTLNQTELLPFDDFCELLLPLGTINSPAELHGFLCGKLCGGAAMSDDQWLTSACEFLDGVDQPNPDVQAQFLALKESSVKQLESGDFDLQLLLPDDDTDMEQRLQALSQWCHGFLSGFGSAGIDPNTQFSSDQADALRDLAAIVQVAVDENEEGTEAGEDDQEQDYFELVEYTRVVVLNFYQDLVVDTQSPSNSGSKKPGPDQSQTEPAVLPQQLH